MNKETHIIEDVLVDMEEQDGKQFKAFQISNSDEANGMYVKICSWDENLYHAEFEKFIGRKVRVTIETID